ncbi:MAG: nucleotidyltransferase family protein [Ilumatobacteraceae bacterium]
MEPTTPRVAALLAAGGGSRFVAAAPGAHKLTSLLRGRPVWDWSLAAVCAAGFDHVVVVTGAVELPMPPAPGLSVVHHADWALGQAGSVQVAVRAAAELGAETVTIGLADQPFVTSDDWRAVAHADASSRVVVARYPDGTGPNPVRLHADVWPLLPVDGDAGARSIIRSRPQWVCTVDCVGSGADIDTLEDLARWNR